MDEFPSSEGNIGDLRDDSVDSIELVIKKLYAIIRRDVPFEEKARKSLEIGRVYLGMDNGHLTRIDPGDDHWEARVSTDSPDGDVPEGLEVDLGATYCRHVVDSRDQLSLYDAPNEGWEGDPAFQTSGLHSYLGTPILVDGETYGTVCFVSKEPRENPFTDSEKMLAEFISHMLERELEREHHEAQLTRQTNLSLVLNRVLRHNLRNDLAVIRGHAKLIAEKFNEYEHTETVLRYIDKLIELSGKARDLDEVIGGESEIGSIDLGELTDRVVTGVREDYPSASISVDVTGDCRMAVLPSFERALRELVENAAKHGGSKPSIAVTVEPVDDGAEVQIIDDGPGISEQEAAVLRTGAETPLTHGSGLGLWLAHWIVSSHDGSIEATATDSGTTMTVRIPRRPETELRSKSPLLRARDQYHAAFEEANDGMVIINDDAIIVEANPAASDIYGMNRAELVGQQIERFLPEEFDFESAWQSFKEDDRERATVTIVGADGTDRLVEYTATANIVPGEHLVVSRDITDEALDQAELRRKTQAMDTAPMGITISDPAQADNPLIYVNDAFLELTGYDREEVLGRNCRFLQGPETDPEPVTQIRESIEAEEPVTVELTNYRKDGTPFRNRVTISPVRDEDGEVANFVGFQERLDNSDQQSDT